MASTARERADTMWLIAQGAHDMYERFDAALRPHTLTPRAAGVLLALLDLGGCHQQPIRALLDVDRPEMAALVDDLEARDLLRRHRDPGDRRAYLLELTEGGRAVAGNVVADLAEQVDAEFTALLDLSARERLCRLLAGAIHRHRTAYPKKDRRGTHSMSP